MKLDNKERGFVYLAFGDSFLEEAACSARELRKHHDYPIILITDAIHDEKVRNAFDEVVLMELSRTYKDKVLIGHSPFKETIFLDTDTLVLGSMVPIFELLSNFDVAVQFTEGGNHYSLPGVPYCFYEPSAGIIAWRTTEKSARFFERWLNEYENILEEQGMEGAWDQRSLRSALFYSDMRIAPLSNEFQFYTYKPNVAAGKVVMIHGRRLNDDVVASITSSDSLRLWIPRVGGCPDLAYASIGEMCHFISRLFVRIATLCLRRLLAHTGVWPFPKNKRPA